MREKVLNTKREAVKKFIPIFRLAASSPFNLFYVNRIIELK